MKGLGKAAVGAVTAVVVLVLLLLVMVGGMMSTILGGDQSNAAPGPPIPGDGDLKPGKIPNGWEQYVVRAGSICPQIQAPIIAAQIETESNWDPDVVSPVGAMGLAQFMPATWEAYGTDGDGDGIADPFNPADAIISMGTFDCALVDYLADAGGPNDLRAVLAAYNAGPGPVLEHGGVPPIVETQNYVTRILDRAQDYADPTGGGDVPEDPTEAAQAVIDAAQSHHGLPYSWGGGGWAGPGYGTNSKGDCDGCAWDGRSVYGFDCSGITQYAFYQGAGIKLPRTTTDLIHSGRAITMEEIQPGDIVVFAHKRANGPDDPYHVATYVGNGEFVHASSPGQPLRTENLMNHYRNSAWYPRRILE